MLRFLGKLLRRVDLQSRAQEVRSDFEKMWATVAAKDKSGARLSLHEAGVLVMGKEAAEVFHRMEYIYDHVWPIGPTQSVALTFSYPRVAALFFDRVWAGVAVWDTEAPHEVLAKTAGDGMCLGMTFRSPRYDGKPVAPTAAEVTAVIQHDIAATEENLRDAQRLTQDATSGNAAVIYGSQDAFERRFQPGDYEVLALAISNLPFISESSLEWEQVLEVRSDEKARKSLRRFTNFADANFAGLSGADILYRLSERYADYKAALKKHGLAVTLGYLEILYDLRSTATAALSAAALHVVGLNDAMALLPGVSLVVGEAAVKVAKKKIDLAEKRETLEEKNPEVAWLAQIAK